MQQIMKTKEINNSINGCIDTIIQIGATLITIYLVAHAATHDNIHPQRFLCLLYLLNKYNKNDKCFEKLTNREKELIEHFRNGNTSYKELSEQMNISQRSVKQHIENINQKVSNSEYGTGIKALKKLIKNSQ